MKINFKKICAVLSLGAIVATSGMAMALGKVDYPCYGTWSHGTTGLTGGGTLYSYYECCYDCTSKASVKNHEGKYDAQIKCCSQAKAELPAKAFKTEYAYYDCY